MAAGRIIPLALAGPPPGTGLAEGHVAGMGRVERLPLPGRNGAQAGRFWSPNERAALVSPRTIEDFHALNDPGVAVAAMNFVVESRASGRGTRLFTETRVRCLGASSRRWFRLYWLVIRPFSGLLRRAMLRGIKAAPVIDVQHARLTVEY